MTKQADLIDYVFEGQGRGDVARLSGELLRWMDASTRFTAFVETYRDKIRKKVRVAGDPGSLLDLRSELEVAYGLLTDRRLAVVYEPYASEKRRGADFAVTYRANLVFNIEVARIRTEEEEEGTSFPNGAKLPDGTSFSKEAPLPEGVDPRRRALARKEERILRILLFKLGQMQPGMPNLLAIHTRADLARSIDLGRLMQGVKTRAESKDPAFYAASRYAGPAAFYKDFSRLSGIVFWAAGAQPWLNKQARPLLDEKVLRLVGSLPPGD